MTSHELAAPPLPTAPNAARLWWRFVVVLWIGFGVFLLDELALLLMDYWLLESLGFESVFWTNFNTGLVLFLAGIATCVFTIGPAFLCKVRPGAKKLVIHLGLLVAVFSGYQLCLEYMTFLMSTGVDFGYTDPVFGNDAGFYVYSLPPMWTVWWMLFLGTIAALTSWVACSWLGRAEQDSKSQMSRLGHWLGTVSTKGTRITLCLLGVVIAVGWWLSRYDVLFMDNGASSVFIGASYVDVTGLFSTVNDYWFTALVTLGITGCLYVVLGRMHAAVRGESSGPPQLRKLVLACLILVAADFAFMSIVRLRQLVGVTPNEPVIQRPYIAEHINATRKAYNLGKVETVRFIPNDVGDPVPELDELLASPTLKNVSLWPGFCSYLEDLVDIQHAERIVKTRGDTMVYGPVLEIFRQQQKLRAYYNFLDVDTIRYEMDGEKRMLVSAVREVPLVEPAPWLAWWGQQYMLFTHGFGLVTASTSGVTPTGEPVYTSKGIPVRSSVPGLAPANQSVYYGEGSGSMAYTNVRDLKELDYPTDEDRAVIKLAKDSQSGVKLDSFLKRLVFGYKSGQFFEIVFSELIDDDTRVHYFRTPLERLRKVAPFLYYDSDPFAVPVDDRIVWIANGITHTRDYPYSSFQELGDKSDVRTPWPQEHPVVNYVRDAVKATVDAYSGQVTFYKFTNEPLVETFHEIYPALFTPAEKMPEDVRKQIQYPVQLMHIQFDDQYILYQMDDTMTFFNMEDMWDDGDEVLGPILDQGHAIRFSIEPFYVMLDTTDGLLPEAKEKTQFALAMVFTPEKALNLRAIPLVYQDGEDYGRLICLQVPKGHYFIGPEQADAAIDQEPEIAQQFTWWTRRGLEVIRGHTTTLVVMNEVIYVEPIFLRSQQNPVTQLKAVCVVFRGTARMAPTLEEALRKALDAHRTQPVAAGG